MNISQLLTKLKTLVYSKSETDSLLGGKASSSHTHTKSQITDFPTIPSKTSQLTNDSGFITGVSWDSVSNKPSTFTPSSHTHTKSQITDFPSLATVATSGSYSDLSNRSLLAVNGATSLGWSGIGGVANGSTLQLCTTDNTSPSICFHRAGYSHVVLAEAGGVLGIQAQGSDWLELATKSWVTSLGYITSSGSCNYANSAGSSSIATRDSGGPWICGRDNAVVKQTRHSTADGASWNPAVSVKTKNGNWTIGTVGYDKLQFSYDTDEDYNAGRNRNIIVELNPESGRIITSGNTGNISISGYQVYVG